MTNNQKLILLLEKQVIPELEDYMDELFAKIASKKGSDDEKEELKETRVLHKDFKEILEDALSGDMEEDECAEIIEELMQMYDDKKE